MKKAFWFTFALSEVLLIVTVIPVYIYAEPVVRLFRDDGEVVGLALRALRLQLITLTAVPLTMVTEMGFQSTGQRVMAIAASSMRSGVVFIPVLLLLANLRGMAGIQEAQPLAFVITFFISLFLSRSFLKRVSRRDEN